ncbi:MAG: hypothetical protein LBF58_02290 [Deltaproteobacteria bacterium]|jgi:hypothetical protein|nr:hypothetical protein [Deltaproteobacteria bacterium]
MAITVVFYFLVTSDRTGTQNLGLFFLLLSEAITIGFLALQELVPAGTGPMFRMGSYPAVAVYGVLSIVTAAVHALGWAVSSTWLILIEVILLGVFLTAEILLYVSSKSTSDADRITKAKMGVITDMRSRLDNLLKQRALPPELADRLKRVIEDVRYFDKNASVSTDTAIGDKIGVLENAFGQAGGDLPAGTDKILDELIALTQIRKREASDSQRGGF